MRRLNAYHWIGVAVVVVLALVLILNPDGWRPFLLDMGASLLILALVSAILFGALLFLLARVPTLGRLLTRRALIALYALTLIPALAAVQFARRRVDEYDLALALLWFIAALTPPFMRLVERLTYDTPMIAPPAGETRSTIEQMYWSDLLRITLGDITQAESLIEYERERHPLAPRAELIKMAVEHWRQDNR